MNYQCQYCDQVCQYTFIDQYDQESNGTLQEIVIEIENIKGIRQIEEFIALHSDNKNQLGLGINRLQQHQNYTIPQNTFLSNVVSICFSSIGFIHKSTQKNIENAITIPYQQKGNVYSFKFKQIKLGFNSIINIENVDVQIDSISMFTELPKDIFSEITNYYKQLGFIIVNSGYLCIHEKKFNLSQISVIQIYINESYYLEFSPKQFLYQSGEYIQLPFKQSKKKSIIFGLTFLDNLYLTINQNQKSLSFSQSDCQSSVQNSSSYKYFAFLLVFSILILFAIIIKLFKKQKQYGTVAQVQEVELQNSTIQREKEDEEEEQL